MRGAFPRRELSRAHRMAQRIEAGNIYINNYNAYPVQLPFGGNKRSGMGRECGTVCVDYFTQIKTVYVETQDVWCPY
jgi:acyl-CoA reductase-like NAD-dependent aldehyde dehydrogenase